MLGNKAANGHDCDTNKGREFYRNTYLKSEHWKNLRLEKLASVDANCFRCGKRDLHNDVHHINYRRLFNVTLDDLVVLCRPCHDLMHEVLEVVKNGSIEDVRELSYDIRRHRQNGIPHIQPMAGHIFRRLREDAKRPVAKQPKADRPKPHEMLKRVSIRLTLGFSGPETKWLFVALRSVGFIEDLQNAYTRTKPKHKKAFANAIDPILEYA